MNVMFHVSFLVNYIKLNIREKKLSDLENIEQIEIKIPNENFKIKILNEAIRKKKKIVRNITKNHMQNVLLR